MKIFAGKNCLKSYQELLVKSCQLTSRIFTIQIWKEKIYFK